MSKQSLCLFWFRRDLRSFDNAGLYHALKSHSHVQPVFIFDTGILQKLGNPQDSRMPFLHQTIDALKEEFQKKGSDLWVLHGSVLDSFKELHRKTPFQAIYTNEDYEPSALARDRDVAKWAEQNSIEFHSFKDQVIFARDEVLTDAKNPYTVYTPFKRKWLSQLNAFQLKSYPVEKYEKNLSRASSAQKLISLKDLGFENRPQSFYPPNVIDKKTLKTYDKTRDFPAQDSTSRLGLHFRFGTNSIRQTVKQAREINAVWLSELIWREFFMQILFHYPHVEKASFRPQYDDVAWRSSKSDFERWKNGETGYPIVDAGMRELRETGHMHNRVRMITASFLTKHLLIYWLDGERYFAQHLLDYDLAANNGNWQWVAGSGCDASPYFRVFNPLIQAKKFDPDEDYIKKWVPEVHTSRYAKPMIEHTEARDRCLRAFVKAVGKK